VAEHQHKPVKRVATGVAHIATAKEVEHEDLRNRILGLVAITAVVDVIVSFLIFLTEKGETDGQIHTYWDAVYFTTTQLLTIGSPVPNPLSTGGKFLNVFLQVYAVVVVASIAGAFGAFFTARHRRRHPTAPS
jgi:hypothetical protein